MREIAFSTYLENNFDGATKVNEAREAIDRSRIGFTPQYEAGSTCPLKEWLLFQAQETAFYMRSLLEREAILEHAEITYLKQIERATSLEEAIETVKKMQQHNEEIFNHLLIDYVAEEAAMLCKLFGVPIEEAREIMEQLHFKIAGHIHAQRFLLNEKLAQSGQRIARSPIDVLHACNHRGVKVWEYQSGLVTVEAEVVIPGVSPNHPAAPGDTVGFDPERPSVVPLHFDGKKPEN